MLTYRDEAKGISPTEVDDGVYRVEHDLSDPGLSITVTLALSEIADVNPEWLIPRWPDYVDPDALDRLFRTQPGEEPKKETGALFLEIQGAEVTIHADGVIEIEV